MANISAPSEESLLSRVEQKAAVIFVKGGVLPWFLVMAVLIFWLSTDNFLSGKNMVSMLRQATYLTMVAMAQMVVLLTAGLDLSVGVMFAITSVVTGMAMVAVWSGDMADPGWWAIAVGCAAGMGEKSGAARAGGRAVAGVKNILPTE